MSSRRRSTGSTSASQNAGSTPSTAPVSASFVNSPVSPSMITEDRPKGRTGARRPPEGTGEPSGITFVPPDRTSTVTLSRDRRTLTGHKGYRMVKATAGVSTGRWFCEFTLPVDMKLTGHVRVGWANESADQFAPVGYDQHSYSMRDIGGQRIHQSIRKPYGKVFAPGDVIGCLIDFDTPEAEISKAEAKDLGASAGPCDGQRQREASALVEAPEFGAFSRELAEAVIVANDQSPVPPPWSPYAKCATIMGLPPSVTSLLAARSCAHLERRVKAIVDRERRAAAEGAEQPNSKRTVYNRFWRSSVRFFVNGEDQGIAFVHLTKQDRYYPAASCYNGGSVRLNPGPAFAFPPVDVCAEGSYKPVSDLEPTLADGLGLGQRASAGGVDLTIPVGLGWGLVAVLGKTAAPSIATGALSFDAALHSIGSIPKCVFGTLSGGDTIDSVPKTALEVALDRATAALAGLGTTASVSAVPKKGAKSAAGRPSPRMRENDEALKGASASAGSTPEVKRPREEKDTDANKGPSGKKPRKT